MDDKKVNELQKKIEAQMKEDFEKAKKEKEAAVAPPKKPEPPVLEFKPVQLPNPTPSKNEKVSVRAPTPVKTVHRQELVSLRFTGAYLA